jgi:hypothetical protein
LDTVNPGPEDLYRPICFWRNEKNCNLQEQAEKQNTRRRVSGLPMARCGSLPGHIQVARIGLRFAFEPFFGFGFGFSFGFFFFFFFVFPRETIK